MVEAHTNGITMFLAFMLSICSVSFTCGVASTASPLCPKDEYRVGIECCPACPAGQQVYKDCEERIMTKCKDCSNGTFQEGFNVKKECSNCTKCDAGLKGKKLCSSKSDAVCEVLDGFFCIDSNGGGCRAAQSHTVCSPGYYIGQTGTADKDTECLPCANGTFSNGTSSCQPHTICESKELKLMKPGTDSTDSECGEHGPERGHVAVIIPGVILLILALIIIANTQKKKIALLYRRLSKKKGIAETHYNLVTTPLMSTDGPEPTRDQQEHAITIPDETMDDQDDDQSLGPAPPSSPTHNGSVSVSVHQEDDKPVHTMRDNGSSEASLLSLGPPSPSKSSFLSPMRSSTSRSIQWSLPLSLGPPSRSSLLRLGPPSTSRSARRFLVRSKSVSSCLENPKLPSERVSLLMDQNFAEEVTPVHENRDRPESESDDSNSLKRVPMRRDHGVSQFKPLTLSARRFRSKSESSHFNIPRNRRRASLLKGIDVAEEVLPVLENLDQPKSESDDSNSN